MYIVVYTLRRAFGVALTDCVDRNKCINSQIADRGASPNALGPSRTGRKVMPMAISITTVWLTVTTTSCSTRIARRRDHRCSHSIGPRGVRAVRDSRQHHQWSLSQPHRRAHFA